MNGSDTEITGRCVCLEAELMTGSKLHSGGNKNIWKMFLTNAIVNTGIDIDFWHEFSDFALLVEKEHCEVQLSLLTLIKYVCVCVRACVVYKYYN